METVSDVKFGMRGGIIYEQSKKEIFKRCIQWSRDVGGFICIHREFFL